MPRGLTIILADPARAQAALEIAASAAALGRPTRLFLQGDGVRLLLGETPMLAEALALGAMVIVCQSALAAAGLRADALPEGVETGGLVGLLADAAEDQLLLA